MAIDFDLDVVAGHLQRRKGKMPGPHQKTAVPPTMKPSPRALESTPNKPAARIRSDLFIALLVGSREMLPLFSEPERSWTGQRCVEMINVI